MKDLKTRSYAEYLGRPVVVYPPGGGKLMCYVGDVSYRGGAVIMNDDLGPVYRLSVYDWTDLEQIEDYEFNLKFLLECFDKGVVSFDDFVKHHEDNGRDYDYTARTEV